MSDSDWGYHPHRVLSIEAVTPSIRELWLAPLEQPLDYRPGEYVLLEDLDGGFPPRSYSIANAPRGDGCIRLLITRYPGGITSTWVHEQLAVDSEVMLTGPYGTFVPDRALSGPVLLLGAGSGIAPLLAIAESLIDSGRPITFAFSARTAADRIDAERLEMWSRDVAGFDYRLTLTGDPAAPRHERWQRLLEREFGELTGWEVFASGPGGFVVDCAREAVRLGATASEVRTEEFFGDPVPRA